MQSINNNSIENKSIKKECKLSIDEVLLRNRDIFNQLLIENKQKKEKSYISVNEYELMKNFENNLLSLVEKCNITKLIDALDDDMNNNF